MNDSTCTYRSTLSGQGDDCKAEQSRNRLLMFWRFSAEGWHRICPGGWHKPLSTGGMPEFTTRTGTVPVVCTSTRHDDFVQRLPSKVLRWW